jgi:uncharacterized protein (DUF2141 family)
MRKIIVLALCSVACGTKPTKGSGQIPPAPQESFAAADVAQATVALSFGGLKGAAGKVCISVFKGGDGFPESASAAIYTGCSPADAASGPVLQLEPGQSYGIAAFHDENDNGSLDKKPFGPLKVPAEGYGFSRNPGFKPGAPEYSEVEFTPAAGVSQQNIDMTYLF